jgi:hypothetical protein
MARQQMEGDNTERRRHARDARQQGKSPSASEVTYGASKQRGQARQDASHQERTDAKGKGKRGPGTSGKPRPGNRDVDPKRSSRWE